MTRTPHASERGHSGPMLCISTSLLRGKSGLTRVEIALLAYVYDHPNSPAKRSEIADDCGCAANSIPRAAKKLVSLGLIERIIVAGVATVYRPATRNMDVTTNDNADSLTRTADVTCNTEDTTLRNTDVTPLHLVQPGPKQTTTDGVVTALRGVVTSPPTPPYKNITQTLEANLQTPEGVGDRGLGKEPFTLEADEPKAKGRRPSRAKMRYRATEDSLPTEPTAKMLEHAAKHGFFNGTVAAMFSKWRDHHISRATEIADCEASWRTWVANAVEYRKRDAAKAAPGLKKRTAPDGSVYYDRDHSKNFYK